jgi:tRNA dimethylallyltransferase
MTLLTNQDQCTAYPQWVIALMGPTASGKTGLAIELARRYPVEIISVDSALVYRGMDIGTAKPSAELMQQIPHHLIDIRDPAEAFSASEFRNDALSCIQKIHQAGKIPLLVGGTMLYYKFLIEGCADLPAANASIRQQIEAWAHTGGWFDIHRRLAAVDEASAKRINPNDPQRLQRALEIYLATGKTMTWHLQQQSSSSLPFELLQLAICPMDRKRLHERIAERFQQMLNEGLIAEVEQLYKRSDLHAQLPAIRSVGYRQVWEHLSGSLSYSEMVDRGVIATRQLAKRQLTWLRSWPNVEWFESEDPALCSKILKRLEAAPIFV